MATKSVSTPGNDNPVTSYDVGDINGDGLADTVTVPAGVARKIEKFSQDPADDYLKLPARRLKVDVSQGEDSAKTVVFRSPRLSYLNHKPTVMDYVTTSLEVKMAARDPDLKYYDKDGAEVVVGTEFRDARTGLPMQVVTLIDGAVIARLVADQSDAIQSLHELSFYARYGKLCATYDLREFSVGQRNRAKEPEI